MRDVPVENRVSDLEHRVERIERRLQMSRLLREAAEQRGAREELASTDPPSKQPCHPERSEGSRASDDSEFPRFARNDSGRADRTDSMSDVATSSPVPLPIPPIASAAPPRAAEVLLGAKPTSTASVAPSPVLPYQPAPAPPPPPPQGELEQTIGLRWAGWVGAIVLVIGAGLGIKYVYDQGWFSLVPAALRLALMSLGGFALIGAGEWVRRKVSDAAAVGLFGAGVATLFVVAHAGYAYFELYQPQTAFTMMALTTLIGAAVALRGRMVSIAVLSLIGGNLAPLVLRPDPNLVVPFLSYLLMLQVVALFLSWWGGSARWRTLRGLSLATTSIWAAKVLLGLAVGARAPGVAFVLIYAALYHVELVATALRRGSTRASADGAAFSAIVNALATLALLWVNRDAAALVRGAWVTGFAVACGAAGSILARRPGEKLSTLVASLRAQSAGLLVLAVPIAFDGATVSLAWCALALAFGATGAKLDVSALRGSAALAWALAVANLFVWSAGSPGAAQTWVTLFGTALPVKWATAVLLALVGQAVAWMTNRGGSVEDAGERLAAARLIAAAASLLFVIAAIAWLPTLAATLAIVGLAWWLAVTDRADSRVGWLVQAGGALGIAMAKWAVVDVISLRLSPSWSPSQYWPVLNPLTGVGVLISASLAGVFFMRRRAWMTLLSRGAADSSDRGPLLAIATAAAALITLALTFDVDRAMEAAAVSGRVGGWPLWQVKQMAWTMLWTVAALGVPAALTRLLAPDRRAAWFRASAYFVAALAIKFLVIDTFLWRLGGITIATIGANVQTLTGTFGVGGLVIAALLLRRDVDAASLRRLVAFLAVLVIAWTGSLEIDRTFEQFARTAAGPFADARLAKQVALSIFWSAFAITSVVAGFRVRIAGLRYMGLALFGLTLLKVVLVDLADASRGYRILSFMGLGLLLLGTSVLYGKLSPKLLKAHAA